MLVFAANLVPNLTVELYFMLQLLSCRNTSEHETTVDMLEQGSAAITAAIIGATWQCRLRSLTPDLALLFSHVDGCL